MVAALALCLSVSSAYAVVIRDCPDGKYWDLVTKACVCTWLTTEECPSQNQNPDTCECIGNITCLSPKELVNGLCVCPTRLEVTCKGTFDPDTCECEDIPVVIYCPQYQTLNETTGECELKKCRSGWYNDGKTGCVACPGNTSTASGDYSGFDSSGCGYNSSNYGANGITDCYQQSVKEASMIGGVGEIIYCDYSDDTGTYQFTNDCKYTALSDIGSGTIGGEVISGGNEDIGTIIKP